MRVILPFFCLFISYLLIIFGVGVTDSGFIFANVPVDGKSARIVSHFTAASTLNAYDVIKFNSGKNIMQGNIPTSWINQAFIGAYRCKGIRIEAAHMALQEAPGITHCIIRLDKSGVPLKSQNFLNKKIQHGKVLPGSLKGSRYLLIGAVQKSGNRIRLTSRIVVCETAVIRTSTRADAAATLTDTQNAANKVITMLYAARPFH